jgi:hypothetical protein
MNFLLVDRRQQVVEEEFQKTTNEMHALYPNRTADGKVLFTPNEKKIVQKLKTHGDNINRITPQEFQHLLFLMMQSNKGDIKIIFTASYCFENMTEVTQ